MYCAKGMELAPAACADCCSDCVSAANACCCTATACCDVSCQLLRPPDPNTYEYSEPEENFVSIDDAKIKSLLLKIGQQQQQERQRQQQQEQQQQPIIELLDDDEASGEQQPPVMVISAARSLKNISPDIQPQRIVARIELSDSESEEAAAAESGDDIADDEDVPAATAVSCELMEPSQVIVLQSDDDEEQLQPQQQQNQSKSPTKRRPTRPYRKRNSRHFYQCQACGKKVQSNYNLRRHMMIHTGERPFPCDLCDRRFREFSDLKKHRRRHINDPRYICMICRLHAPMEQDSTRCSECEGKNLVFNPPGCEVQSEEELDLEPDQESEPELKPEEFPSEERAAARPAATSIESQRPMLTVTLVPAAPLSVPSATTVTVSVSTSASQSRPPLPRSCSSANSSSSLSNDVAPSRLARSRSRRTYPCPLCQRVFGTRHNLKRHYMIHTGEKPFSCSKCRKPFRECSTLKKHMVTHVRERWYKCLRCPAKYHDYLHYTEHRATHGLDTQLEPDTSSHQRHRSSDSEDGDSSVEDWLECCECQVRFTQLDAYTEHLKQHDLELYGVSVDDLNDEEQDVDVA